MTACKNPNEKIFYVYVLLDPTCKGDFKFGRYKFPFLPFYVGKGKGDRVRTHHLRSNKAVKAKIKKITKKNGTGHKARIVRSGMTESEAYALETRVIRSIGLRQTKEGPLLNFNEGGPGVQQNYVSKKTRKRRSDSLKAYWAKVKADKKLYEKRIENFGKSVITDERRAEMSEQKLAFYRTKAGERAKEKLSKSVSAYAATLSKRQKREIYTKAAKTKLERGSIKRCKLL